MTHRMTLDAAKAHVETVLLRREHIAGQRCDTVEIITWSLDDYPEAGFRIAEVSWSLTGDPTQGDTFISAGSSVMQSDMPLGLASCAAVERWIVGLMMGDALITREARMDFESLGRS